MESPAFPTGRMKGPEFARLLARLQSSGEFELIDDRSVDWGRYRQRWRHLVSGEVWVLDYPFERGLGRFERESTA